MSLLNQSFLVYSSKDDDFNSRFKNKEETIKISDILRASSEGKVYYISIGENNQITQARKMVMRGIIILLALAHVS